MCLSFCQPINLCLVRAHTVFFAASRYVALFPCPVLSYAVCPFREAFRPNPPVYADCNQQSTDLPIHLLHQPLTFTRGFSLLDIRQPTPNAKPAASYTDVTSNRPTLRHLEIAAAVGFEPWLPTLNRATAARAVTPHYSTYFACTANSLMKSLTL